MDPRRARNASNNFTSNPPPPPPPPPPAEMNDQPMGLDGAADLPPQPVQTQPPSQIPTMVSEPPHDEGFKLKFCTVCASNNNRSMESHLQLASAGYPVISFGTGSLVRLPGPSVKEPNIFNFNRTSYDQMYNELFQKDPRLYRANGILPMLDRNRNVKWGPERWQDWKVGVPRMTEQQKHNRGAEGTEGGVVDIVITCEERCWDSVVDDLLNRGSPMNRPVHVFNVDIKDNHEDALVGGRAILDLAGKLNEAAVQEREKSGAEMWDSGGASRTGFDERVPYILADWQERWPHLPAIWTLAWF